VQRVLADGFDSAQRCTNLALVDIVTKFFEGFGNVHVGHRTKQTTVDAGLGSDSDGQTIDLALELFSLSKTFSLSAFKLSLVSFEFFDRSCCSTLSLLCRDQVVTSETVFNFDDVAELTDVRSVKNSAASQLIMLIRSITKISTHFATSSRKTEFA